MEIGASHPKIAVRYTIRLDQSCYLFIVNQ